MIGMFVFYGKIAAAICRKALAQGTVHTLVVLRHLEVSSSLYFIRFEELQAMCDTVRKQLLQCRMVLCFCGNRFA